MPPRRPRGPGRQRVEVHLSQTGINRALSSPGCDAVVRAHAIRIMERAKLAFYSVQRKDNEFRLSETSPPDYIKSFKVYKVRAARYIVANTDPAAIWVEYGAHAGGRTFVLGYRPLTKGLMSSGI
jgi:hypothetical protein